MKIKIVFLADYPEFIPVAAEWMKQFWGVRYPERSIKEWEKYIFPNKNEFPLTVIALDVECFSFRFIGMATIKYDKLFDMPAETLWLSGVFVVPFERRGGVASSLIKFLINFARQQEIPEIFLFTRTNGDIYKKLGWQVIDRPIYQEGTVLLMKNEIKNLSPETKLSSKL